MSRSVEGLVALNALFGVTGLCLLWGSRGLRDWLEVVELLGLALVLGIAAVGVLATAWLSLGGDLSFASISALCLAVATPAVVAGIRTGRPLPRTPGTLPSLRTPAAVAALACALLAAAALGLYLRLARVQPLVSYDGWAFWVPKAKTIYFFGGLDGQLFRSLGGTTYPLLVPALQAMDFRFMGSADASALTLQYWLLFAAFVTAVAAVLRRVVPPWLVWLFLALVTLVPEIDARVTMAQADWPLDMFFALAAAMLVCWLRLREPWLLLGFGVLLAATLATKREGLLLAACLLGGCLASRPRLIRRVWLPVGAVAILAEAPSIPWRIWWGSRGLNCDACVSNATGRPAAGSIHDLIANASRIWPSLKLVLRVLFAYDLWLLPLPIALVAAAASLGLRGEERALAVLVLTTCGLAVVGFTWILWETPALTLDARQSSTPIPRVCGGVVLFATVLAPLLIDPLLHGRARTPP